MKKTKNSHKLEMIALLFALCGLVVRSFSIIKNLSFWNDEGQVALMARYILERGLPVTDTGTGGGLYQVALYYITALSFKIFGISEWAGRLPSVLAGILLIISGMYISRKVFGIKVAAVIAFLFAFSQIQLAWSAQLRPYIWMELFTIWIVYYLYKYNRDGSKAIDRNLFIATAISGLSILFHGTGLVNLLILFFVFIFKTISLKQYKYLLSIPIFVIVGAVVIYNSFTGGFDLIMRAITQFYFSPLHYRIFLTHNYLWLVIGATVGFFTLYKKNKLLAVLLGSSIVFIFAIAIFKINPRYIRYSLPGFPLMYLLFAEGVVSVIDRLTKKESLRWFFILLVFISLSFTGKFVFWPKYYYSINADMRENPIVDYKLAFANIKELISDKEDVLVIDAWNDRVPWYLPNQEYIMANVATPEGVDPMYGEKFVGTLDGIKNEISDHKSGVVIVEDWQSFMSDEIKEYVRKNLKFEFTVQDLPYNENDHWGISVYSWGI